MVYRCWRSLSTLTKLWHSSFLTATYNKKHIFHYSTSQLPPPYREHTHIKPYGLFFFNDSCDPSNWFHISLGGMTHRKTLLYETEKQKHPFMQYSCALHCAKYLLGERQHTACNLKAVKRNTIFMSHCEGDTKVEAQLLPREILFQLWKRIR